MAIDAPATAAFALSVSIIALYLLSFLDHSGTAQAPPAPLSSSAVQEFLTLAGMEGLVAAVAFIYGEMNRARAAGAGAVNRRISELVTTILCASGLLFSVLFVQPAGGAEDDGAATRALGAATVRALPAAATGSFFLGVMLIYAHVGNRVGEGDGADAGAGAGPVPQPAVNLLAKATLGAAVAVVSLMAMALNTN